MTDRELMQQALDAFEVMIINSRAGYECLAIDAWRVPKTIEALRTRLAQKEPEPEKSQDKPCIEDDECPTEKAVLQRFWREHQAQPEPYKQPEDSRLLMQAYRAIHKKQPEPEPVAWGIVNTRPTEKNPLMMVMLYEPEPSHLVVPLYAASPQRKWQELTDEDRADAWAQTKGDLLLRLLPFSLAIEAKLKEKNEFTTLSTM